MDYFVRSYTKKRTVCLTLVTATVAGACALSVMPAQSQNLEAVESSSIGAQIQFNNQWGQSFEVTGPGLAGGVNGVITPFASTMSNMPLKFFGKGKPQPIPPLVVPNSGVATFSANVQNLSPKGGDLSGQGKVISSSTSDNIVLNQSSTKGIPSITINSYSGDAAYSSDSADSANHESTFAANILGTNIGVDNIQVTGTNSFTVINDQSLTAF